MTLQVGGLTESVTVTAEAPQVDLTSAQVGGSVTTGEITELPSGTATSQASSDAAGRGVQRRRRFIVRQRHHQRQIPAVSCS